MKVFYKKWVVVLFVVLVSLLPSTVSASTLWTEISASADHLCGPLYDSTLTIRAVNISNTGRDGLFGINATLITEPNDLLFLTSQTVPLGDLPAYDQLSTIPIWVLSCKEESSPGNHSLFVVYRTRDGPLFSAREQAFIVEVHSSNSTPLRILDASPSGVVSTSAVRISVQTDKDATCRYDVGVGGYDDSSFEFSLTGGTRHREVISSFEQGLHQYYITCRDEEGFEAQTRISFEIDTPPFARIRLDPPPPLKEGVVKVILETSEELRGAPSLNYSFDGSALMSITLVQSSSRIWEGYLLIPATGDKRIGSFGFFATDLSGNSGTEIHEGGSFLIDMQPPQPPSALVATEDEYGRTEMSWYHGGDDIDHYNIYRSSLSPDLVQFYKSTHDTFFVDAAPPPGTTYFYRVTTVDLAGNEGEFSDVVPFAREGEGYLDASEDVLNPEQEHDTFSSDFDDLISSVKTLREELNQRRDDFKESHKREAGILNIDSLIRDKKTELVKLQNELELLRSQNPGSGREKEARDAALEKMADIKKSIPITIVILEEEDILLDRAGYDDLFSIVERFRQKEKIVSISDGKYEEIEKYQGRFEAKMILQYIEIHYLDGTKKKATLIHKQITLKEGDGSKNGLFLENIPKTVAKHSSEIAFEGEVDIIDEDPLFAIRPTGNGEQTIRYLINGHVDRRRATDIQTVFLPDGASSLAPSSRNVLTGFSIFALPSGASFDKFYNVAIVAGIIILMALLVYHFSPNGGRAKDGVGNQEGTEPTKKIITHNPFGRLKQVIRRSTRNTRWLKEDLTPAVLSYKQGQEKKGLLGAEAPPLPVDITFPYPNNGSKEYASAGIKWIKGSSLFALMHEMDGHITHMDYDAAARLYHIIVSNGQFTRRWDANAKKHFARLQAKLDLLLKMNQLHACEEKEDYINLKYILNEIADLYNSLLYNASASEMEFLNEIERHHERCARLLLQRSSERRR